MGLIEFHEEYSTNIKELDKQHKEFFDILNKFFEACKNHSAKSEVEETLDQLGKYSLAHLKYEEEIMLINNYKNFNAHRAEHSYFLTIYKSLKDELAANGPTTNLVVKTNKFLINWLIAHLNKWDKDLAIFLKNKTTNKQ